MRRGERRSVLLVLQPEDGGVAQIVSSLAHGLSERDWTVEVAGSAANVMRPGLEQAGIAFHVLPLKRAPGRGDLASARALRRLTRDHGYSVVHAHSSKAGGVVRLAIHSGPVIVYSPHCFSFEAGSARVEQQAYRAIEQTLVASTDAFAVSCEWERSHTHKLWGAPGRTRRIYNGVDAADLDTGERASELVEFAAGRPLAAMVAVLRPQKDPLTLVRAVAILAARGEPAGRVAIVGNGELRDAVIDEIDRLRVGQYVRWFPFSGSVTRYLGALDLFVLPSLWEAFPVAILEAMAVGLPVLATPVGGVSESVGDRVTGRLVAPGDPAALAEVISELLADRDRLRAMGEAGRQVVATRFGRDRMVAETAQLYDDLLPGRVS